MSKKDVLAPDDGSSGDNKTPDLEDDKFPKFTKAEILKSHWYSHKRGALADLLEDGKTYSHAQINKLTASK